MRSLRKKLVTIFFRQVNNSDYSQKILMKLEILFLLLQKISINFPSANPYNNEQTPYNNLLPFVSEVLYNNQIPLYNAFFAPNETVLILKNKDAARAYELLRAKITK